MENEKGKLLPTSTQIHESSKPHLREVAMNPLDPSRGGFKPRKISRVFSSHLISSIKKQNKRRILESEKRTKRR